LDFALRTRFQVFREPLSTIDLTSYSVVGDFDYYHKLIKKCFTSDKKSLDLAKIPETERAKITHDLRVKYFGQAQADKIDQEEKIQNQATSETNAKMDQFLAAEKEYIRNNPTLSPEARLAGVENLRKSILGQ
jgi:hypothetical protein